MNPNIRFRATCAACVAVLVLSAEAASQTVISTVPETPTWAQAGIGKGAFPYLVSETWGELFTVPTAEPVLQQFSFWQAAYGELAASSSLIFSAFIMGWEDALGRAAGPILYQSTAQMAPTSFAPEWTRYDFQPAGGLVLVPAGRYVAFLSTSPYFAAIPVEAAVLAALGGVDGPGNQAVFQDSEGNVGAWTTQPWSTAPYSNNLAFEAVFGSSVVPEPASLLLFATGLMGLALAVRRRSRLS